MSPYGIGEVVLIIPLLALLVWFRNRYETDGADVPEFEAWCRMDRPVLFAVRCRNGHTDDLALALRELIGDKGEVVTHRGRFPWTRHVLSVAVEVDRARRVVRGRVHRARIRRVVEERPELGRIVDGLPSSFGDRLEALWLQAELAPRDNEGGTDRSARGWAAEIDAGRVSPFIRTHGLPTWAAATDAPR